MSTRYALASSRCVLVDKPIFVPHLYHHTVYQIKQSIMRVKNYSIEPSNNFQWSENLF